MAFFLRKGFRGKLYEIGTQFVLIRVYHILAVADCLGGFRIVVLNHIGCVFKGFLRKGNHFAEQTAALFNRKGRNRKKTFVQCGKGLVFCRLFVFNGKTDEFFDKSVKRQQYDC